jgi:hypothetical protein
VKIWRSGKEERVPLNKTIQGCAKNCKVCPATGQKTYTCRILLATVSSFIKVNSRHIRLQAETVVNSYIQIPYRCETYYLDNT